MALCKISTAGDSRAINRPGKTLAAKVYRFCIHKMEGRLGRASIGDDSAMTDGITYRHLAAHRIETILCRKDQQVGGLAHLDAVAILHVQGAGAVAAD